MSRRNFDLDTGVIVSSYENNFIRHKENDISYEKEKFLALQGVNCVQKRNVSSEGTNLGKNFVSMRNTFIYTQI